MDIIFFLARPLYNEVFYSLIPVALLLHWEKKHGASCLSVISWISEHDFSVRESESK